MRVSKPAILLIFFSLAWAAGAGATPAVRFTDRLDDKKLVNQIVRSAGNGNLDSVSTLLSGKGYLNHSVLQKGDSVLIDAGPQYRIGAVYLMVIHSDGEINELTNSAYRGRVPTQAMIEWLKEDIIDEYRSRGHYFASLHTDRIQLNAESVDFHLRLITGPVVVIERLRFRGLTRSKPDFVAHLSGLREGEPLIRGKVDDAVRKIESEGYLQNDSVPVLTPNRNYDRAELLFYLSEQKSNRLELGGGYVPRRGNVNGEFVGRVDFESKNLFGWGRKLALLYDRKDRASSRTEFRFAQPMFIPDHLEFQVRFTQVDYDSSYHDFMAEGGVSLITRGGTRLTGSGSWAKTEPQRASQPPSRTITGRFAYEWDHRVYPPNPSGGRRVQLAASYIRRSSRPASSATTVVNNESVFEIGIDNYFPLSRKWLLRINAESRVRISSRELIDFSEQFKLGGFGSLRGYRQDQFAGRRVALGQAEVRLRPSSRVAFYLFADVGFVYARRQVTPDRIDSEEITRPGAGLGMFAGSAKVRMTMELGWGRHDRIEDGKIHLGLSTLF